MDGQPSTPLLHPTKGLKAKRTPWESQGQWLWTVALVVLLCMCVCVFVVLFTVSFLGYFCKSLLQFAISHEVCKPAKPICRAVIKRAPLVIDPRIQPRATSQRIRQSTNWCSFSVTHSLARAFSQSDTNLPSHWKAICFSCPYNQLLFNFGVCVCVRARACARPCVRTFVRACLRARVHAWMCACVYPLFEGFYKKKKKKKKNTQKKLTLLNGHTLAVEQQFAEHNALIKHPSYINDENCSRFVCFCLFVFCCCLFLFGRTFNFRWNNWGCRS